MRAAVRRSAELSSGDAIALPDDRFGLALGDLRRACAVSQVELARRLDVCQATVSKFERSKPSVSTVRRYVEALGGRLVITAIFDEEQDGFELDC